MSDVAQNSCGTSCCPPAKPKGWQAVLPHLKTPWTLVVVITGLVALLDWANFIPVVQIASKALIGTLPYIVVAVLLLAYLKSAGAQAMIARAFQGREGRMIVLAALFGGLAPFCSCEVIPFIAGLLALGAPLSAVMAFWLSSPLIDPPTLIITASALGWHYALAKALAAVGIGLAGGFALKAVLHVGAFAAPLRVYQQSGCCGAGNGLEEKPVWAMWNHADRRAEFGVEMRRNFMFLLKWLALAYVLEALLITYVPADLIVQVVGGEGIGAVIIGAVVGMPAYLNSYASVPLLAGLVDQGMSAGAAMAFMVAGPISSIPAMAAVWSLVRPPVFLTYLGLGLVGAITAGALFGAIY